MIRVNKRGTRLERIAHWFAERFIIRMVEVTKMDLALGEPGISTRCPVALAMRRLFPKASHIRVWGGERAAIDVEYDVGQYEVWRSDGTTLAEFVKRFDRGDRVDPITFAIHLEYRSPKP